MHTQTKGNDVIVYPQALCDALLKRVYLRVGVTNWLAQAVWMCFSFDLRHRMSRDEHWEDLKRTRGEALAASRGALCFELTALYFKNYALFDKTGGKEKSCPALLSHMVIINFRTTQHIPRYPGYVKLHPEQKTWWRRWRLGTWGVMTPSLVITEGVLLAWYPGILHPDENVLERCEMV